jgi:hypothetical protein
MIMIIPDLLWLIGLAAAEAHNSDVSYLPVMDSGD